MMENVIFVPFDPDFHTTTEYMIVNLGVPKTTKILSDGGLRESVVSVIIKRALRSMAKRTGR